MTPCRSKTGSGFSVGSRGSSWPRPGTAAPRLDGEVDRDVAAERLQRLFALEDGIQYELNRELIGQEHEVLVTGWGKQPGTQTGRTACHRIVHFPASADPVALGQLTRVRIEAALAHSLLGRRGEPAGMGHAAGPW